jgi:hypothetical protein
MEVNGVGHEVIVCRYSDCWKLVLRRSDVGPIELPAVYPGESGAIRRACDLIQSRRQDLRYAHEVWFCLAFRERPTPA